MNLLNEMPKGHEDLQNVGVGHHNWNWPCKICGGISSDNYTILILMRRINVNFDLEDFFFGWLFLPSDTGTIY
jgi:hypothetical protein